jgi:hypothetical protein
MAVGETTLVKTMDFGKRANATVRRIGARNTGAGGTRAVATLARGLGWFSIALGAAEFLAPKAMARLTGVQGYEPVVQIVGFREIVTGIGTLADSNRLDAWLWGRTAGDALDLALLGIAGIGHPDKAGRLAASAAAVAGVAALDCYCARHLDNRKGSLPHRSNVSRI